MEAKNCSIYPRKKYLASLNFRKGMQILMHFLKDLLTSKQLKKRYSLYFSLLGLSHGMKMQYT